MKEIDEFLNDQKAFDKAQNTIEGYEKTLSSFDALTNKPLEKIDSKDVIRFISEPSKKMGRKRQNCQLKLSTKKITLNRLNKFFDWAIDENMIESNPVTKVRKGIKSTKVKKELMEILSVAQVSKLVKMVFNPHERIILVLLYKTGMREGELANIDIEDIDITTQSIKISDKPGNKTGERIVYLDSEGWKELQDWLTIRKTIKATDNALIVTQRKSRISNLHIWQIVRKYGDLAFQKYGDKAYQNLHPHIFRHAFTTHLAMNRILTKALQMLRGDSDKTMIDVYSHLSDEQVRKEYLAAMPKIL